MLNEIKLAFTENKVAIFASIAILFVSLILGYYLEPHLYNYLNPVVDDLTQKVETGVLQLTFKDIFLNNVEIILRMFIYGLMCCFSAVILSFNGFFVGYYVAIAPDFFVTLLLIVPHGIFEFSSCIISCAAGFVLFNFLYRFLKALWGQQDNSIHDKITNAIDASYDKLKQAFILFLISVILMAIAGFIEVYLTIPIAKFVVSILS